VSNDLLGEDVLPAHERAVRNLLKPGGRVILARGRVPVALAEDSRDGRERLGEIDGFDLSPFNKFTPPVRQIRIGHERLKLRGDRVDLFAFDLGSSRFCAPRARRSFAAPKAGA